jgi:two-component system CheB/CheR fusion protein
MATKKKRRREFQRATSLSKPVQAQQGRLTLEESTATDRSTKRDTVVVGIGASAGGLDALKKLITAMPVPSGMAFVLIQHLEPTHKSLLVSLLAKHTTMVVIQAADRMRVEANTVYSMPPDRYLSLRNGTLRLTAPIGRRALRMPIDFFLRSLAESREERSIGVVLSGTGTDGTSGLKAIKAHGGMTMVQDPDTTPYDGMPRSAIATGVVDHVLPVEQMPPALIKYVQHSYFNNSREQSTLPETAPDDLNAILGLLRNQTKQDFRFYKKNTVSRRIERRMGLNDLARIKDYINFLRETPDEVRQLFQDLLIGVTGFFRESDAFKFLEEKVVPLIIQEKNDDTPLRVWVPGCATGEEPYSIAMLLLERFSRAQKTCELQIFSTDIDGEALAFARQGIYPESIIADVSHERLRRFFKKEGHSYQVNKQVRESVVFAVQNVISDPAFSKLDLISCRNLLIYIEPEVQKKILARFHSALHDHGYLFLARAESVGKQDELFRPVANKWRIYRKVEPGRLAGFPTLRAGERRRAWFTAEEGLIAPALLAERIKQLLLAHYAPVWLLVNREQRIVHFHGPTGEYLEMPIGEPTMDLLRLARKSLRTKLKAALQQAMHEDQAVTAVTAPIKHNGGSTVVTLTVRPVSASRSTEDLFLIIFESTSDSPAGKSFEGAGPVSDQRLSRKLAHQLGTTRGGFLRSLQQITPSDDDLKSSNEDVMSMNEELQSTNEELETSKEELQSLNEELSTVNSELQEKVDELTAANTDLANLLSSTDIAAIFLDMRLCIKRFTPATTKIMNLIPSDLGRPISDISQRIPVEELLACVDTVLRDVVPLDKEVQTNDGQWYTMRVLPYRTLENKTDGVIMTFSNVTRIKEAGEALNRRSRQQAAIAELGDRALAQELDPQALMEEAVKIVAQVLNSEQSAVFEFLPKSGTLYLRAGVGWKAGCVGKATVPATSRTYTGFALTSNAPVIVDDFLSEKRFASPQIFTDHGVRSGSIVVIQGRSGPLGLLGVYSTQRKRATEYEVEFLQSLANVLAHALGRLHYEEELKAMNQTLEERVLQRTGYVKLLQDVVVIANTASSLERAFLAALERICKYMDWPVGHAYVAKGGDDQTFVDHGLWFIEPPNRFKKLIEASRETAFELGVGITGRVAASATPEWIPDVTLEGISGCSKKVQDLGVKAAFAFPVLIGKRVGAVLEFFAAEVAEPDVPLLEVMAHIGAQLGRVVERQRLQQELFAAVWQQQRRFGQELHDNLGQQLAGVAMMAKSLEQKLKANSLPSEGAAALLKAIQEAQKQVRSLAKGLFPVQVEAHGLMSALEELALTTRARHGITCRFECDKAVPIKDNSTATHLFQITQEAVTNAVMHGHAHHVAIGLQASGGSIGLTVRDDGVGIQRDTDHRDGTGLHIMEYRASLIGANLAVGPAEGGGTLMSCQLRQDLQDAEEEH